MYNFKLQVAEVECIDAQVILSKSCNVLEEHNMYFVCNCFKLIILRLK